MEYNTQEKMWEAFQYDANISLANRMWKILNKSWGAGPGGKMYSEVPWREDAGLGLERRSLYGEVVCIMDTPGQNDGHTFAGE